LQLGAVGDNTGQRRLRMMFFGNTPARAIFPEAANPWCYQQHFLLAFEDDNFLPLRVKKPNK
jgi:hypothetical protein